MAKKNKGLGMGLEALLGETEPGLPEAREESNEHGHQTAVPPGAGPALLALSAIQAGSYQPRNDFDSEALQSLADSISQHGVMQPIVVRPLPGGTEADGPYEIIAGERRFRAAGMAGLMDIPAIVRSVGNEQALAMALIENIQREDLNPLEEARAIKQLIDEFDYTHDSAAKAIGRSRSATTNLLRLLALSAPVQQMLADGELDMGHARALAALSRADQIMLAHRAVERAQSVRETEAEVTAHLSNLVDSEAANGSGASAMGGSKPDRDLMRLQNQLADILAAPVRLKANTKGRGSLTIQFASADQFEGLLQQLGLRKKLDQ